MLFIITSAVGKPEKQRNRATLMGEKVRKKGQGRGENRRKRRKREGERERRRERGGGKERGTGPPQRPS